MLIISCFLPWVYFNSNNETFTGFYVSHFPNGIYYGRAGIFITILTIVVIILMLVNKPWVKAANLFISGLIFAYCIRTYFIFTASLFPNEVIRKPGIYMILIFSLILLVSTLFPNNEKRFD